MKTHQKFYRIFVYETAMPQNVDSIGRGNAKMEDLSVAVIDIPLRVFGILLGNLKAIKRNF